MRCLRCGTLLRYTGSEQIQLGKANVLTGTWSNVLSGALKVAIYECPTCGKLEFFNAEKDG